MSAHNPYLAPASPHESRAPQRRGIAKWIFAASLLAPVAFPVLASTHARGQQLVVVACASLICASIAHLVWVARTWSMLPYRARRGRSGTTAALLMIVPLYQHYWAFAFHARIHAHLARRLAHHPSRIDPPSILAWLVPGVGVAIALTMILGISVLMPLTMAWPVLGFVWMYRVDDCFRELAFQAKLRDDRRAR